MSVLGFSLYDRSLRYRHRRIVEFAPRWGFALELALFSETGWSLIVQALWGKFFVKLPFLPQREPHEMMETWGFAWLWDQGFAQELHLHWGRHTKIVHMPWEWRRLYNEVLLTNGAWDREVSRWPYGLGQRATKAQLETAEKEWAEQEVHRFRFKFPYRYCLHSFEIQRVEAEVTVGRSFRCRRWVKWLGWPRKSTAAIDVKFSGEVGERAGSWKGGTIGCGYTLRTDETPQECLRRMERERKF